MQSLKACIRAHNTATHTHTRNTYTQVKQFFLTNHNCKLKKKFFLLIVIFNCHSLDSTHYMFSLRMPVPRCVWACLAVVLVLVIAPASSLPQNLPIPLRNSPRALLSRPYRPQNTQLASLVETFAQNDIGKGHMFDLDLPNTSDLDAMPSLPSPPKFNINTFTFNEKNVRKPGDIFSLLADVKGDVTTNEPETKQENEASKPNSEPEEPLIKIPGIEVVNTFGKKILMATKDFQNLMSVVQRMKKKVDAKLGNTTTPVTFASPLSANVSNLVSLLLDSSRLQEIRTAGLTAKTEDEFLDQLTSVLIGGETRGTALTLDPVTIIALLTLGRSKKVNGIIRLEDITYLFF